MMRKLAVVNNTKKGSTPYFEMLKKAKAIDLRNNHIFVDMGNGYGKFEPIDKTKVFK